ncbi:metal-dependent phosphohydrolase [Amaricoccus solimangrovi]|uniref:Metal-dependent phosphohydrolase n=1 Tax=Amaricoccus solimangrovi TaxID=2589815 RepID=A0A501WWI1_9RHOB|nr:metal-dependent phosphohydrolase [Amaricoccus solimangrovi]TPE52605.1 metal-dependent phosphohydrolase [Amaricoccus solimangrovi]
MLTPEDFDAAPRPRWQEGDRSPIWGAFDLEAPSPIFVASIPEIATALSRLVRFNGWGPRFYSVAEHSIFCDEIAREAGIPARFRRAVLMHDAAEVYCGDNIRPLKALIPDLERLEQGVARAIAERFDLPLGFSAAPFDNAALAAELREFFPFAPRDHLPDPGPWQPPRLAPDVAALEFLRRAEGLGIG